MRAGYARAKSDRGWRGFVGSVARIVKEMPLWKLQTLRRRNVPFLYEKSSGPRITLLPGVAFNLRRFGALIQLLARSSWLEHIRANPRNAPAVGGATKTSPHVDHFIPWSRHPRDLAQNFVLAHGACNLDKGDMLSAPGLRPGRGRVGAALGEFEIRGECRPAVSGDTGRVRGRRYGAGEPTD